ncbi:MAG: hypothetical protein ACLFTH_05020 [Candidatus Woesearchaeota archaeon]
MNTKQIPKWLKTATMATLIGLGTVSGVKGQNNLEALVAPSDMATNRARTNLFYEAPAEVSGYTFIEFYDNGYLAKSNLTRELGEGDFSARAEVINSNYFTDHAGVGVQYNFSDESGSLVGSVKALPLWVDKKGIKENTSTVGYFVQKRFDLPKDYNVTVCSFGEANILGTSPEGDYQPQWGYGETSVHVGKDGIPVKLGIGADMRYQGKGLEPKINIGPRVKVDF